MTTFIFILLIFLLICIVFGIFCYEQLTKNLIDKFCPPSKDWPIWAEVCATDALGRMVFYSRIPYIKDNETQWTKDTFYDNAQYYNTIILTEDDIWEDSIRFNPNRTKYKQSDLTFPAIGGNNQLKNDT